jgi:magnesium transporter
VSEVGEGVTLTATATAPDELGAARALNNEYLKRHPEEVARFLDGRSAAETVSFIAIATPHVAAQVLERLNPRVAAEAIGRLTLDAARNIITAMNPARAAPIVVSMPVNQRDALLMRLDSRIANEIREMLSYPPESAGALMDPRISAFGEETSVDDALRKMRTFKEKDIGAI